MIQFFCGGIVHNKSSSPIDLVPRHFSCYLPFFILHVEQRHQKNGKGVLVIPIRLKPNVPWVEESFSV